MSAERRASCALVAALAALLLAACASPRPDLARLYERSTGAGMQPPVVVVHGVLGARLVDEATGEEVWPGALPGAPWTDYSRLAVRADPATLTALGDGLRPAGIFDALAGRDFYGEILRMLAGAGGYRRAEPGEPVSRGDRVFYVFDYDWRQDNVLTAAAFGRFLARIRADHGDASLAVDVVAHSNGGLVARYYARYGEADVLDGNAFDMTNAGARHIRRMVLLGTPNFGSMAALSALVDGTTVGLGRIRPEVLATMPSATQLLPHALNDWLLDADGSVLDRDLFDVATWQEFGWGPFDPAVVARVAGRDGRERGAARVALLQRQFGRSLERARRFTWSMTVPEAIDGPRLVVLGGDCTLTPARGILEPGRDRQQLRIRPGQVRQPRAGLDYGRLLLEPGDGTVTKASLLARESLDPRLPRHRFSFFPLDYSVFLCERHERLTGNPSFQDNLLHALLSVDR